MILRIAIAAVFVALFVPASAHAQLLSESVSGSDKICIYVGTEAQANGDVGPRTVTVEANQRCPAIAPYRDPNAPVPGNAALMGERTTASQRICLYSQGGVRYQIAVDIALSCAVTPELLEREQSEDEAGYDAYAGEGEP